MAPVSEDIVLGDDLAILSLRVAQEIDRKLKGKSANPSVFSDFSKQLSKASGIGEPDAAAFLYSDPITTEVFAQAIKATSHEPVSDIYALGSAVLKIIKQSEELNPDDLESIKVFCLSLHRSMMAQKLPPLHERENTFEDELRFVR